MTRAAMLILVFAAVAVAADEKPKPLYVASMEVGQIGVLRDRSPDTFTSLRVKEIIKDGYMLVVNQVDPTRPFILKAPTKGLVDDKVIEDIEKHFNADTFKVASTAKRGTKTYFVLEPIPRKK